MSFVPMFKEASGLIISSVKVAFGVDLSSQEEVILKGLEEPNYHQQEETNTENTHNLSFLSFSICKFLDKSVKDLKKYAREIVEKLGPEINKQLASNPSPIFEKVLVPSMGGYVLFFCKPAFLGSIIPRILDKSYLKEIPEKSERVMIEYSQPNTHKTFHVGHMRNASLGMCLVQLFEFCKYKVTACNYYGDIGTHIAKCLWYYLYFFRHIDELADKNQQQPTQSIGENGSGTSLAGDTNNNNNNTIVNLPDDICELILKDIPKDQSKVEFLGLMYQNACTMLDFSSWTTYFFPGYYTAKVLSISDHPTEKKWKVVKVSTGSDSHNSKEYSVVCGGKDYKVDDIVVYVPVGSKKGNKTVSVTDFKGVNSEGMILSEAELGISKNRDKIYVFPNDKVIAPGIELTELARLPDCPKSIASVSEEANKRTRQVRNLLKQMEDKEPKITALWELTRRWCIREFKEIYKWIDCRFDYDFHESDVQDESKEIILEGYKNGKLIKSEGAIGADLGGQLGFFVLLTSDGTSLYSTKDIALAKKKFEDFKIDRSIYVVDASQSLHFQQVFKTLKLLGFEKANKCYHLAYGLVTLPEGKMSSRQGTVISFSQLKEQLYNCIMNDYLMKYKGQWPDEELAEAARKLSVATIKYGMLKQDPSSIIIFSLAEWSAKTGNTGPYLMYAHARTRSILREVTVEGDVTPDFSLLTHDKERILLGFLGNFLRIAQMTCETYKPHLLCNYLYSLCKAFSRFYEEVSVRKAEPVELKKARLMLAEAFGDILKQGLSLLGIQSLERM